MERKNARLGGIKLWHSHMRYLCYETQKTLKNFKSGMEFKETTSQKLCENCQKKDQICQLLRNFMSQSMEFLIQVYNDLEKSFL